MLPTLFSLGPVSIQSYALFLVVGLFAFLFVVWKVGKDLYFDESQLFDSTFRVLLFGVITARVGYVMLRLSDFGVAVWQWVNILGKPGFLNFSGFVGGVIFLWWEARRQKYDVYSFGDVLAQAYAILLAILALGAFFSGTGYGNPTELFFGIQFPGLYEKRLPIQLLESLLYGLLFGLLYRLEGRYRTIRWYKGKRSVAQTGFISATFLIGFGIITWLVSFFKPVLWSVWILRLDRWFGFGLVIIGIYLLLLRSDLKLSKLVGGKRK